MSNTSINPATATLNKDCLITNNTSVDVVVLDAISNDETSSSQTMYEMPLTLLSAKDGQKILKAGASGTFTLDDYHKGPNGDMVYTKIYMLIIAKADNLYPVKLATALLGFKTQNYPGITITEDDYKNMQLAENFQQTITAYPSSDLARNFQAVMNGSPDDLEAAVANFFQSTNQYKAVNLNMINAISTYYSQYAYVWGGYQGIRTYFFYDISNNQVNPTNCSLRIKVPATVPANPDKALPGFTFIFTDASNKVLPLYYANNRFVNDLEADVPAISLTGLFTLKNPETNAPSVTAIVSCLTGTVYGMKVMGYAK